MKDISNDYRCACGKLLFRGIILNGNIEVKCRSCKRIETIESFNGSVKDTEAYMLVLDAEGILVHFSSSTPAIVGYSGDELLQKHISDIIVILSPGFYSSLYEALNSKCPTVFIFQSLQRNKDRSLTPIEVETQYLSGSAAAVVFTVRKKGATHLTIPIPSTV